MALLSLGLVACDKDFDPEVGPQSNPQEGVLQVTDVTVSSESQPKTISLAEYINAENGEETLIPIGIVNVEEGAMPINSVLAAQVEFSKDENFSKKVTVKGDIVDNVISVSPSDLQKAYFDGITRSPKATDLYVRTALSVVTNETAVSEIGEPGYTYFDTHIITFTPQDMNVKVSSAYYLVGGPLDWAASAASKEQVFSHSDIDVYDDPVFTYIMQSTGSSMWFAFGDDEALDAITNESNWTKLFGTKGNSDDLSGSFDTRENLGGDHSFNVDGAATYYKIVINVLDMTYEITPVTIAAQYYLVGALQGWNDQARTCLMTPEGNNMVSYTTQWTGDHNLKIWAADDFGNWDAALGTPTDGDESMSGTIGGNGAIKCPEGDAFYKFTIDLGTMTYTWTKLDDQAPTEYQYISLIGKFNGWGSDYELTQVTPHNWHAVFTQEENSEDGAYELKFRANHDWGINWGFGSNGDWDVSTSFNRIGTNGAGNIIVPPGTYDVYLNDITGSMMIVAQ